MRFCTADPERDSRVKRRDMDREGGQTGQVSSALLARRRGVLHHTYTPAVGDSPVEKSNKKDINRLRHVNRACFRPNVARSKGSGPTETADGACKVPGSILKEASGRPLISGVGRARRSRIGTLAIIGEGPRVSRGGSALRPPVCVVFSPYYRRDGRWGARERCRAECRAMHGRQGRIADADVEGLDQSYQYELLDDVHGGRCNLLLPCPGSRHQGAWGIVRKSASYPLKTNILLLRTLLPESTLPYSPWCHKLRTLQLDSAGCYQ